MSSCLPTMTIALWLGLVPCAALAADTPEPATPPAATDPLAGVLRSQTSGQSAKVWAEATDVPVRAIASWCRVDIGTRRAAREGCAPRIALATGPHPLSSPADRIVIATALELGLVLASLDQHFPAYPQLTTARPVGGPLTLAAQARRATLATRNPRHFDDLPAPVVPMGRRRVKVDREAL